MNLREASTAPNSDSAEGSSGGPLGRSSPGAWSSGSAKQARIQKLRVCGQTLSCRLLSTDLPHRRRSCSKCLEEATSTNTSVITFRRHPGLFACFCLRCVSAARMSWAQTMTLRPASGNPYQQTCMTAVATATDQRSIVCQTPCQSERGYIEKIITTS